MSWQEAKEKKQLREKEKRKKENPMKSIGKFVVDPSRRGELRCVESSGVYVVFGPLRI